MAKSFEELRTRWINYLTWNSLSWLLPTATQRLRNLVSYIRAIAKTLGFKLIEVGLGTATIELSADTAKHANPMGTIHGGVLCDIADAAIGTAHATSLEEGETFTSIDLQINFFRPVWKDRIRSLAKPVNVGSQISRYVCDIVRDDDKLVAQVTSTIMILRGERA